MKLLGIICGRKMGNSGILVKEAMMEQEAPLVERRVAGTCLGYQQGS